MIMGILARVLLFIIYVHIRLQLKCIVLFLFRNNFIIITEIVNSNKGEEKYYLIDISTL